MKNYKQEDIPTVLEKRRQVLHHLEQIEMHLWTDNIDEAIARVVDMHLTLVDLTRLQSNKRLESKVSQLHQFLNANGVNFQFIPFRHKKTD